MGQTFKNNQITVYVMFITSLFTATILVGVISIILAMRAKVYAINELKKAFGLYSYTIILLSIGFMLHSIGDGFSIFLGDMMGELFEAVSHIIILIALIMFYITAQQF